MSSSVPHASSTFWLIDTTSVSDTFTTTATFTLWVPLYTTSTARSYSTDLFELPNTSTSLPPGHTAVIAGSAIGSLIIISLLLFCVWLYRRRHTRPLVRRTLNGRELKAPDTAQSSSAHALLDLTAEPEPHPETIEPWIEPVVTQQPAKLRLEDQHSRTHAPLTPPRSLSRMRPSAPATSSTHTGDPLQHAPPSSAGTIPVPTRTLQIVAPNTPIISSHPGPPSKNGAGSSQTRRRRNRPEVSPPRLEEDAGVSLMRAGEGATDPADELLPPAYDLAHTHYS
ncbi:hypothetical protein BDV93DRAFT_523571 [Ceratobasidium sp. AG-I]|nr:hypothetical protein BDV93DRAFT_523571 [Ceratobasidium sp. AG-I]